jgi:2-octaprenyl-6-methoxyphenol hydroxylase
MNAVAPRVETPVTSGRCDVAIVGGGLVGASLACALAPLGLKIVLLEAVPVQAASQPSYDDRTLALSESSCRILQGMGIWPALEANATSIREIYVTERHRPGRVVLDPRELGLKRFGCVVEARVFGAAVLELLANLPAVEVVCPARVTAIHAAADEVRITYQRNGQEQGLHARLLVGADGAESVVRTALGIAVERRDYGQTAVICSITPEKAHGGRAWECFTPTGPFAVLPHVNGRCGLVWSVASDAADDILQLPDDEFLCRAQGLFGDALGPWRNVGKRSAYPLRLVRATTDIGPRSVLLGNAAHAIHPMGAQGFNLGLRDVAVLAEVLSENLTGHAAPDKIPERDKVKDVSEMGRGEMDIGAPELLERYSAWRAPDQAGTIGYSDGLARLYANPGFVAGLARGLGLLAHALIPPLRRHLAIRAMGYRGRIPRLALGERLMSAP